MQWIHGPLGVDGGASLLLALVLVGGVAWTLHQLVEEPGHPARASALRRDV